MRPIIRIAFPFILGILILLVWMTLLNPGMPVQAVSRRAAQVNPAGTIDISTVISKALEYVKSQQMPDGGIAGFGLDSDPDSTSRAVLALAAAGRPVSWMTSISGTNMVEYLASQAFTYTHDTSGTLFPGRAGILLTAISAVNENPTNFGGMDIISELESTLNPATGAYSSTATSGWSSGEASDLSQAWAILGLSAAVRPVPDIASNYLVGTQAEDGSWGFGDLDTTALAVTALLGSGNLLPNDETIQAAMSYFRNSQLTNGAWRPVWDSDLLNADSTGWILQSLQSVGYTNPSLSWMGERGDPVSALVSLQKVDGSIGGSFANAYSTVEALYGLTGEALFNLGPHPRSMRALTWLNDLQKADGSWPSLFGHPAGATADAALAYLGAGFDIHDLRAPEGISSTMDYLSSAAAEYANIGPDSAGKLALVVAAAGDDLTNFGDINILDKINEYYDPVEGGFGVITNTWHQAYAILGLEAAGEDAPAEAINTLQARQQPDGGWRYDDGPWNPTSDPDSTALSMQALIASGISPENTSIQSAVDYLHGKRDALGGWGSANSTAFAIQGLLSAGVNLTSESWQVKGHDLYHALAAYQKVDGPFYFNHDLTHLDDAYATRQSIPALLSIHYPFTAGNLTPFTRVQRGADPDRAVESRPVFSWGKGITVTVPIGSDLNQDAQLVLDWRIRGAEDWVTGTILQYYPGFFSAILPVSEPLYYEVRTILSDTQGVQFEDALTHTITLTGVAAPNPVFLPLAKK